jgi:protein-disulfide isomerase
MDPMIRFMNRKLSPHRRVAVVFASFLTVTACSGDDAQAKTSQGVSPAVTSAAESLAAVDTIDIRRLGYSEGSANAPVTVVEFSDFGCPFCAMFSRSTYPALKRDFVDTGAVRWVYIPFVMGNFRNGAEAARAGECAAEQDRFGDMKERIYAGQNAWRNSRRPAALFADLAAELGLDEGRFASCYREDRRGDRTRMNNRAADALRIRATPSFFINGRLVEGAVPEAQFRAILSRLAEGEE